MPKCMGCGNEIPVNGRFCSICGRSVGGPPASAATPTMGRPMSGSTADLYPDAAAGGGGRKAALIAGGLVALALVAFLLVKASGVLGSKKAANSPAAVLNAPPVQTVGAPMLNAPPVEAPHSPVLQPPDVAGTPMPDDVIAYLRWLKQFEAARRDLEAHETAELQVVAVQVSKEAMTGAQSLGTLDNDPTEVAPKTAPGNQGFDFGQLDKTVAQWNQVAALFQQKTPPNPCASLATSYNGALSESVRQMSGLVGSLRSVIATLKGNGGQAAPDVMGTLASLEGQKNSRSGSQSIDAMYGDSNSALDTLRNKYTSMPEDIDSRHFDVKEGGGGGGLGLGL